MASTIQNIRDLICVAAHGSQVGFTAGDGYLAGPADTLRPVTNATSATTGTNLPAYGVVTLYSTTGDSWILDDPAYAGVAVEIIVVSTDTNNCTVTSTGSNIRTTAGSSFISAVFDAEGEALRLVALTTALWAVTSNVSDVTFTT